MAKLNDIVSKTQKLHTPINKICEIKTYLPIKEKFKFVSEYKDLLVQHINDYENVESFIAYIFFNLMAIKKYTNIDLECTYEEYDLLQENNIMNNILDAIGDDYMLLMKLIQNNKTE